LFANLMVIADTDEAHARAAAMKVTFMLMIDG
jgi:hypothetical protein